MKWFKFYGQDFQTDPKISVLSTPQKLLWVNLLCIASQDEEHSGEVKFLTEDRLKTISGIVDSPRNDDWEQSLDTFELFEKLGLIEIPDEETIIIPKFNERQDSNLTDAERAKRYRDKKKIEGDSDDNYTNVTDASHKRHTRIDKIRIDKNIIKREHSLDYLKNFPLEDFSDIDATEKQIRLEGEKAYNWCLAKGKTQKNYKAFLRNWVLKTYKKKSGTTPTRAENYEVDEKGMARIKEMKEKAFSGSMIEKGIN